MSAPSLSFTSSHFLTNGGSRHLGCKRSKAVMLDDSPI